MFGKRIPEPNNYLVCGRREGSFETRQRVGQPAGGEHVNKQSEAFERGSFLLQTLSSIFARLTVGDLGESELT